MAGPLTQTGALRAWWSLLVVFATAVLVGAACIAYTQHVQRESDHRWCALLDSLDQPSPPPSTDRGREIQRQISQLRHDLGCEAK